MGFFLGGRGLFVFFGFLATENLYPAGIKELEKIEEKCHNNTLDGFSSSWRWPLSNATL